MEEHVNPVVERSKKLIRHALFRLMEQKPYASITLIDIAREAGVVRQTVYRNYDSKDDIIKETFRLGTFRIQNHLNEYKELDTYTFALERFRHYKKAKIVIELIVKNDLMYLLYDALLPVHNLYMSDNTPLTRNLELPENPYTYAALSGMIVNVTIEWVRRGMKESPEEMAKFISELGI